VAVLLASDPGEPLCLGKATQMPMAISKVMPTSPSRLITVSPYLNRKKERFSMLFFDSEPGRKFMSSRLTVLERSV
jgi:hypothetical protein